MHDGLVTGGRLSVGGPIEVKPQCAVGRDRCAVLVVADEGQAVGVGLVQHVLDAGQCAVGLEGWVTEDGVGAVNDGEFEHDNEKG